MAVRLHRRSGQPHRRQPPLTTARRPQLQVRRAHAIAGWRCRAASVECSPRSVQTRLRACVCHAPSCAATAHPLSGGDMGGSPSSRACLDPADQIVPLAAIPPQPKAACAANNPAFARIKGDGAGLAEAGPIT